MFRKRTNACCPYCSVKLDSTPKRKKKCPHCGKYIFVRNGQLMTEDDASIEDWLVRLARFDITRVDFDVHRQQLSNQFGSLASVNDTIWRILNLQTSKIDSPHTVQTAYYEMARLVSLESRDPKPYIAEALRVQLKELESQGIRRVVVVGYGMRSDSSCPECKALHGREFDIDVAFQEMPIPTVCKNEFGCKCSYMSAERWKALQR